MFDFNIQLRYNPIDCAVFWNVETVNGEFYCGISSDYNAAVSCASAAIKEHIENFDPTV